MKRVAVITGGSSGIGRHLVSAFAQAGYEVVFTYHGRAPEGDVVESARFYQCDAGDPLEVEALYAKVDRDVGAPDVLVNNAGVQTWSGLLDLAFEDWQRVIQTNLTGCFLNTQAAARLMVAKGKPGSIINIGSGCNKLAFPKLVDYTASKGGVEQLTKVSAVELGPFSIRVNCVAPGAIMTERTQSEAKDYSGRWAGVTPLRRVGAPEDVAGPVLFLAGDAAAFVTGQTLWVDGGAFTQANWPSEV